MRVDVADYRRAGGAIILPNPNAPTGIALPRAEIARLLADHPDKPVVIDEAYVDFGAETAIPLIAAHPNLLVVQTMSKSRALAGLRVGYALGDAGLIEALRRVKDSFNSYPLDRLAQAGAVAAIEDEAYFQASRATVMRNRERLSAGLAGLGFSVLPSAANFVFARHERRGGAELAAALRERAVLVRHFAKPERIAPYLRISVGSEGEIARLLSALEDILSAGGSWASPRSSKRAASGSRRRVGPLILPREAGRGTTRSVVEGALDESASEAAHGLRRDFPAKQQCCSLSVAPQAPSTALTRGPPPPQSGEETSRVEALTSHCRIWSPSRRMDITRRCA